MSVDSTGDEGKVCPRCAETVKAAAQVCRYCGFEFQEQSGTPDSGAQTERDRSAARASGNRSKAVLLASVALLTIAITGFAIVVNGSPSSLSDAERVWCAAGHDPEVTAAGRRLGIDETMIFLAYSYQRDGQGVGKEMQSHFDRACKAAFESR